MRLSRRSVLRAGGLAAVGSLAGCRGVLGGAPGGSGPRDWQFDVGAVSETSNRFFGSFDHARLYEVREHLPEAIRETVETASYTPLDAEAVESLASVAGLQFGDYGTGSTLTFSSVVALGSFDRAALQARVRTDGNPDAERDYAGARLFEGVDGHGAGGLEGVPGDDTPFTMAAVAVADGAVVVGSVRVRGRNAGMVLAEPVVEATVDAGLGDGPRLHEVDDHVRRLTDLTGESTVSVGARAEPARLAQYRQAPGPIGAVVTGLQAGGAGMIVDGETAEVTLAGLYEDAASAEAADAIGLVEEFAAGVGDRTGIEVVEATTDGEAVVVTVIGGTRSLLDGSALGAATGSGR